ncbi:YciI family protein [Devosia sp. SL43]|uniref:YciI family protein n=1 Tax=Devosia sp. SL43 TaxID=2806348 RepID=UPI001F28472B|nr:YciI family protein [Devosia sp. SL43]UJW84987.1 hypothetical protein IM737_16455 [Devosia sp. SL43]
MAAIGLAALPTLAAFHTVPAAAQPAESGLFVLLVDVVDPSRFEELLPAHSAWLHAKFEQGIFITSGGLGDARALAMFHAPNQAAAEALMADEPLYSNGVAKHEVLQFTPRFINAAFAPVAGFASAAETTVFESPLPAEGLFALLVDFADPVKFEELLPVHVPWLEQKYEQGVFVASGSLGDKRALALFKAASLADAEALMADEPLNAGGAVVHQVLQFNPRFHSPALAAVVTGGQSTELAPLT